MKASLVFLCLLVFVHCENYRPFIGILSEPNVDQNPSDAEISASYVKWLAQGGSRSVVIPFDASESKLRELFSSINGLLFTGGDNTLDNDTRYFKTSRLLYKWAIAANDQGIYFPVWGTCQGFQLLSVLAAEDQSVLLRNAFDSWNIRMALLPTKDFSESRLFGSAPDSVIQTFTKQNSTQNLHHNGVLPESYEQNEGLKKMFVLLSTNFDRKGKEFGSTMEGRNYPFYATQWHPERNQFEFGEAETLDKSANALEAMQYLSNFFNSEVKKNYQKFQTPFPAEMMFNFQPTWTANDGSDTPDQETYYFKLGL